MNRCRWTAVLALAGLGIVSGCTNSWIGNGQLMSRFRCGSTSGPVEGTLTSGSGAAPCCDGGPNLEDPAAMPGSFMTVPGNGGLPMISSPQGGYQPGPMPRPLPDDAPMTPAGPSSRVKTRG